MFKIDKVNNVELNTNGYPSYSLFRESKKRNAGNLKTGKRIKNSICDELCIYGVKLNFEEMREVLLTIGAIVYRKEYLGNHPKMKVIDLRKFIIGLAYETIKKKGEIYDFDGVRVLNIYNFFEHFEFNKRYTDITDTKKITPTFKNSKTKICNRFCVDIFGAYSNLIDVSRNDNEIFIFGVYVATVNRDYKNIFLYQSDLRVVDNFKKYCVPALKGSNKKLKPSFHYILKKE